MYSLRLSGYQIGIVVLYIALTPFFVIYRNALSFGIPSAHDLTAFGICFFALAVFFAGMYRMRGQPTVQIRAFLPALGYGVLVALAEEIIFRGVIQNYLQQQVPVVLAVIVASVVFGLAHLSNGATSWRIGDLNRAFAGLTFMAGLPLGALYALTGSLFLPTLLHAVFVVSICLWKPSA